MSVLEGLEIRTETTFSSFCLRLTITMRANKTPKKPLAPFLMHKKVVRRRSKNKARWNRQIVIMKVTVNGLYDAQQLNLDQTYVQGSKLNIKKI
jgi:hypothetical protein